MSNEVNIVETFYGTIDPGVLIEFYDWSGNYDDVRKKARFFTVEPDPALPFDGGTIEVYPNKLDLELTRSWVTVWVDANDSKTFQRNASVTNIGEATAAYHLLRAETDN
jgi:hypothetical protein